MISSTIIGLKISKKFSDIVRSLWQTIKRKPPIIIMIIIGTNYASVYCGYCLFLRFDNRNFVNLSYLQNHVFG